MSRAAQSMFQTQQFTPEMQASAASASQGLGINPAFNNPAGLSPEMAQQLQMDLGNGNSSFNIPGGLSQFTEGGQQSMGLWQGFKQQAGDIFGFGQNKPQLGFVDANMTDAERQTILGNNQALSTQAQQSAAKWGAVGNVMSGITGLGGLYLGKEQLDLAKDNARFQKKSFETNLANQTKSYNTQLEQKRRQGMLAEGNTSKEDLKSYMDKHGL